MFADDVIIFSKAEVGSLLKIKEALNRFHGWSGLEVNINKSEMFFGGCDGAEKSVLAHAAGVQIGKLPFSYLGVLIDGRSLRSQAYEGIIAKMTSKIRAWAARQLSYAGRLVLIKHVLSTISSYWMRVLIFPKNVLRKISAICRNFLWSGSSSGKKSLVAWKRVTTSKEQGGLGIKNVSVFNKALMLNQVWDLCLKKDSMWIRWMHVYFFSNQNFWDLEEKTIHSWVIKNILRLRQDAQSCIQFDDNMVCSWAHNNAPFSAKGAYEILAENGDEVLWSKMVWNGFSLPKHSFCTWLAIQSRLYTKDKIRGMANDHRKCSYCSCEVESINHLFFQCSGLNPIYKFLGIIGIQVHWNNWEEVIQWQQERQWSSKAEKLVVFFIITVATYETWKAWNHNIFRDERPSKEHTWNFVLKILKMKMELIKKTKAGCSMYKLLVDRCIIAAE